MKTKFDAQNYHAAKYRMCSMNFDPPIITVHTIQLNIIELE
jgi:hypothetical protein